MGSGRYHRYAGEAGGIVVIALEQCLHVLVLGMTHLLRCADPTLLQCIEPEYPYEYVPGRVYVGGPSGLPALFSWPKIPTAMTA